MKKAVSLILCVVMIIAVMAGCGQKNVTGDDTGAAGGGKPISQEPPPANEDKNADDAEVSDRMVTAEQMDTEQENIEPVNTAPEEDPYRIPNEYFSSLVYNDCVHGTYILKDYKSEIKIPEDYEFAEDEELYIYRYQETADTGILKQRCEKFLSCLGLDADSVRVTKDSESEYEVCKAAMRDEERAPGTLMENFSGNRLFIRSGNVTMCAHYFSEDEISARCGDVEFTRKLVRNDPVIKAACTYADIEEPELCYRTDYDCYGDSIAEYYIVDSADDPLTAAETYIALDFHFENEIWLFIRHRENFEEDTKYPVIPLDDAIERFCRENDIDPDSVLDTGFAYMERYWNIYVPCYLLVLPGDNEFIKIREMDLSVYQEYDVVAVPAVEIE